MFSSRTIIRFSLISSILIWLVMVYADLNRMLSDLQGLPPDVPVLLPNILLDLFIVAVYYFYRYKLEKDEQLTFTDLLWKVFAAGLVSALVSLTLRLVIFTIGGSKLSSNTFFNYFIYQINYSIFIGYLIAAYTVWKRLVLHQKTKWVIQLWMVFDISLLAMLVYDSLGFTISGWLFTALNLVMIAQVLMLSVNMRWVAFLNFRQKLTALLILLCTVLYLVYFAFTVTSYSERVTNVTLTFLNFQVHIYNLAIFLFVVLYSIFSFLVVLFNLPTSSAFEQKLEEVLNFQRLSQSIHTEQDEQSVYRILLESSVKSVGADAAWLNTRRGEDEAIIHTHKVTPDEVADIRGHLEEQQMIGLLDSGPEKSINLSRHMSGSGTRFRSILAFPIMVNNNPFGTLALLKEVPDGFDREMARIVSTFANQAGITIENFRLLEEALQNERYQEELKIARSVQQSLLPTVLEQASDLEVMAYSESADEVGGDYYDTIRTGPDQIAGIIADVSGKGTTAAFQMSQMKGIFHSLARREADPADFLRQANRALVKCIDRGSFISALYFTVDHAMRTVHYSRGGHCPVLYFKSAEGKAAYLTDKGTALGMVRNDSYDQLVNTYDIHYAPGDVMLLFTDGITEARKPGGEEYGYDRLAVALEEAAGGNPKDIIDHIVAGLHAVAGPEGLNDDHTMLLIKFKDSKP
ncbi:MAG: PP2C family protein-serine/threonine phosphatase [Bacteroidota bacterium]